MTSLTLHLIVIILLAAAALNATGTATSTPTTTRTIGGRRAGSARTTSTTTTSTQAPTLRAPWQRRLPTTLPTTLPIEASRSRYNDSSSATALPAPTRQQRRRGSTTTTTAMVPTPASNIGRSRNRGSIRAARQPRDTPTLGNIEGSVSGTNSFGKAESASSWRQSHQSLSSASSNAPVDFVPSSSSSSNSFPASFSRSGASALKTPRMIQRLVAGHIHNAQGHSTYEVSAVSANSSRSSSVATTTTAKTTTIATTPTIRPLRRKASSSYRLARPSPSPPPDPYDEEDEALLNEPDDFDNWDNGILRLSAGSGKETSGVTGTKGKSGKEDSKKTLADQVKDGKYGLIEKELFRRVPKRPGVLSYARNSEVPLDNDRNFGGLSEQDIWLAEDHLLVIKGGGLNEAEDLRDESWPAIDDYDAPPRQIGIPPNPVIPPPFPVQLEPNGPLQLIRDNQIESIDSTSDNGTLPTQIQHASNGQAHNNGAHDAGTHIATRTGALTSPKTAVQEPSYVYPAPYAPWLVYPNETMGHKSPPTPSPTPNSLLRSPLLGPWLMNGLSLNSNVTAPASLHGNISDFDEDDPSLYYPPAYSFVYKSNYSNLVPPGPLVPGIVLPPPPDHFTRLELTTRRSTTSSSTSSTTSSTSTSSTTTPTSTTRPPSRLSLKYNAIGYLPLSPTPRQQPKYVERVPVPVAIPIPIYPINYQPTTPHSQVLFVPSTERSNIGERERIRDRDREAPLSKSNPIYYEYFEAKRQPSSLKSNVIDDFLATKPPKRSHYKSPPSPVNDVSVVSITPKPLPQQHLHSEHDTTLGQLLRSNLISPPLSGRFQPPDFDRQPFLPMVNYSADEQDQNAFKAIVYQPQGQVQRQRQLRVGKHQQLQLQQDQNQDQDSYLPQRNLRVGKQQLQLQVPYEAQTQGVYSTPLPPAYLENSAKYQLRPPAAAPAQLQYWQRPAVAPPPPHPAAPQFKRLRHNSVKQPYQPYFMPSYPTASGPSAGVGAEPLYRLLPVSQHKNWRNKQQQQIQLQPQQQQQPYYPDRGVNIGHSLASDILVNYNSNNQFNPQAELVPQALGPPPLSYQAQNGGQALLWSDRPTRQSRAQQEQD